VYQDESKIEYQHTDKYAAEWLVGEPARRWSCSSTPEWELEPSRPGSGLVSLASGRFLDGDPLLRSCLNEV
jgi:hypothetical protein